MISICFNWKKIMSVLDPCFFLFLNSFVIVIFYVSTFPLSFFSLYLFLSLSYFLSLLLFCPLFLSHQYFVLTLPVRSLLSGAIISCLWKTCRLSLTPTHTHTHWHRHRHRQHSSLPRHQGRIQSKQKYMHFFSSRLSKLFSILRRMADVDFFPMRWSVFLADPLANS